MFLLFEMFRFGFETQLIAPTVYQLLSKDFQLLPLLARIV